MVPISPRVRRRWQVWGSSRAPFSHHRTTDSQPTTLHCAAFRCSVDGRAAGDRMRVPRSGTRTEHLRRAADCVRADLPPAVLLTVVVRHGATRHGGRNGRLILGASCLLTTRYRYPAVTPPSMEKFWPVTQDDSSDAR